MARKNPRGPSLKNYGRAGRADYERARRAFRASFQATIARAVDIIADSRKIPWRDFFTAGRGPDAISAARVFAMAVLVEIDVPPHLVARAFSRKWATVASACERCAMLRESDADFREEWRAVIERLQEWKNHHAAGQQFSNSNQKQPKRPPAIRLKSQQKSSAKPSENE
jgi:hypothetical protein